MEITPGNSLGGFETGPYAFGSTGTGLNPYQAIGAALTELFRPHMKR